jgi:hypothetical protein
VRAWYSPSWNGDWRLEADPDDDERTRLTIVRPTPLELRQLSGLSKTFLDKGWIRPNRAEVLKRRPKGILGKGYVTLSAPLEEVGPIVTAAIHTGPAILTAVTFKDGLVLVCEVSKPKEDMLALPEPSDAAKELAKKPDAQAAVTVKRPTPCCPPCYVDAVGPATDVLLAFLDAEQHEDWRDGRFLVCRGGLTGHRYLIAHRHTAIAARNMRIAYDLDDRAVLHFHDWTVPPEEEVLAAKIILEHREPWLRNEATALGGGFTDVFKNPFGTGMDGVVDSQWTQEVGRQLSQVMKSL